jgi:hypothetical protein
LELPDTINHLAAGAFARSSLRHITLPKGITHINSYTFSLAENLESLDMPEGLLHIGPMAFDSTQKLREITIPRSVNHITDDVFTSTTFDKVTVYDPSVLYREWYYPRAQFYDPMIGEIIVIQE